MTLPTSVPLPGLSQTRHCLIAHHSLLPFPLSSLGIELEIGGIKGENHGLRQEQFTENCNEIGKLKVTATILI